MQTRWLEASCGAACGRGVAAERHAIRDRLKLWAASVEEVATDYWPEMPGGIVDRDSDIWEALLTVADLKGAAAAQSVVASAQPNAANWAKVADAYYLAGDTQGAQQAIAEAAKIDPKSKAKIEQQVKSSQEQGAKFTAAIQQLTKQQQKGAQAGGGATGGGQNPLNGLGLGGPSGGL